MWIMNDFVWILKFGVVILYDFVEAKCHSVPFKMNLNLKNVQIDHI